MKINHRFLVFLKSWVLGLPMFWMAREWRLVAWELSLLAPRQLHSRVAFSCNISARRGGSGAHSIGRKDSKSTRIRSSISCPTFVSTVGCAPRPQEPQVDQAMII